MLNSSRLIKLYIVAFIAHNSFGFLYPVIPLYATELGATVSQVGLVVATTSYATALLLIPMGMLSDRAGRGKFLVISLVICTLAPLLYPFTANLQQIVIVRIIHGLGQATFLPTGLALVNDFAPAERRGEVIGWYSMSSHIGLMAGPLTGGLLLHHLGFNAAFYGCGALPMLGLVFILSRLSDTSVSPSGTIHEESSWTWLKQKRAIASLLAFMIFPFGVSNINAYIPIYGKGYGITETGTGLLITIFYAGSALLRAPAGRLSDRFGREPMIVCGLLIGAISLALISQFHSLSHLIPVIVCSGIALGITIPPIMALVADLSSKESRGLSMGIMSCVYQLGMAMGPTAMGFVAEMSNFETMYIASGAILILAMLIIIGIMRAK